MMKNTFQPLPMFCFGKFEHSLCLLILTGMLLLRWTANLPDRELTIALFNTYFCKYSNR